MQEIVTSNSNLERHSVLFSRWDILLISIIAFISWVIGASDTEVFGSTYYSTKATYAALFNNDFLGWYPNIGLGTPSPFAHHLIPHPLAILSLLDDPLMFVIIIYVANSLIGVCFLRRIFNELCTPDFIKTALCACYLLSFISFNQILIKTTPSSHFAWSILPAVSFYAIRVTFLDFRLTDCIFATFWLVTLGMSVHPSIIISYALPFSVFLLFSSVSLWRIKAFFFIGFFSFILILPRVVEISGLIESQKEVARMVYFQEFDFFLFNNFFIGIFPFFSLENLSLSSLGKAIVSGSDGTTFDWNRYVSIGPFLLLFSLYYVKRWRNIERCLFLGFLSSGLLYLSSSSFIEMSGLSTGSHLGHPSLLFVILLVASVSGKIIKQDKSEDTEKSLNDFFLFNFYCVLSWFLVFIAPLALKIGSELPSFATVHSGSIHMKSVLIRGGLDVGAFQRLALTLGVENYCTDESNHGVCAPGGNQTNALSLQGIEVINGFIKGQFINSLVTARKKMGSVYLNFPDDFKNKADLAALLGVKYVLASRDELLNPDYHKLSTFSSTSGSVHYVLYENLKHSNLFFFDLSRGDLRDLEIDTSKSLNLDYEVRKEARSYKVTLVEAQELPIKVLAPISFDRHWKAFDRSQRELRIAKSQWNTLIIEIPAGVTQIDLVYKNSIVAYITLLNILLSILGLVFGFYWLLPRLILMPQRLRTSYSAKIANHKIAGIRLALMWCSFLFCILAANLFSDDYQKEAFFIFCSVVLVTFNYAILQKDGRYKF
jgi:hypothetical protein